MDLSDSLFLLAGETKHVIEVHFKWCYVDWFPMGKAKEDDVKCRFCGSRDGYVFLDCTFPLLVHVL